MGESVGVRLVIWFLSFLVASDGNIFKMVLDWPKENLRQEPDAGHKDSMSVLWTFLCSYSWGQAVMWVGELGQPQLL